MADNPPFRAEYAKSGRAGCKSCKTNISQGSLRIAKMVQVNFVLMWQLRNNHHAINLKHLPSKLSFKRTNFQGNNFYKMYKSSIQLQSFLPKFNYYFIDSNTIMDIFYISIVFYSLFFSLHILMER